MSTEGLLKGRRWVYLGYHKKDAMQGFLDFYSNQHLKCMEAQLVIIQTTTLLFTVQFVRTICTSDYTFSLSNVRVNVSREVKWFHVSPRWNVKSLFIKSALDLIFVWLKSTVVLTTYYGNQIIDKILITILSINSFSE